MTHESAFVRRIRYWMLHRSLSVLSHSLFVFCFVFWLVVLQRDLSLYIPT